MGLFLLHGRLKDPDGREARNPLRGPQVGCHFRLGSRCDLCTRPLLTDAAQVSTSDVGTCLLTRFRKDSLSLELYAEPQEGGSFAAVLRAVVLSGRQYDILLTIDLLACSEKKSLNAISHDSAMGLIRQALDKGLNLVEVCIVILRLCI